MQVSWQDLLFGDSFQGDSNQPFDGFLKSTTRVAAVGHNAFSIEAHALAMADLAADNWQRLNGFSVDERLVKEVVAKKLAQMPGIASEDIDRVRQLSQQFAIRCQLKRFVTDQYLALLHQHYARLAENTQTVDWQWLLYKPAPEARNKTLHAACAAIAAHIFWNEELARQVTDNAIRRMSEDNWAKLSGYQGLGSAEGYFKKVFHTQVQDFFKAMYGSCQPKVWIRNAGAIMVKLFKKLCCEKIPAQQLCEHHEQLQRDLLLASSDDEDSVVATDSASITPAQLKDCIRLILQKEVNCQQRKFEEVNDSATRADEEGTSVIEVSAGQSFEDEATLASWQVTLIALQVLIGQTSLTEAIAGLENAAKDGPGLPLFATSRAVLAVLQKTDQARLAKLQLTEREKLTVQYRFIHHLSRLETAAQMSQQLLKKVETHQVRYEEEKALEKLKKLLADE